MHHEKIILKQALAVESDAPSSSLIPVIFDRFANEVITGRNCTLPFRMQFILFGDCGKASGLKVASRFVLLTFLLFIFNRFAGEKCEKSLLEKSNKFAT